MYIDLLVLIILLIVVVFVFKRFSSFVYSVAIIDIFLRIVTFIRDNVPVPELKTLLGKYFPESIPYILDRYTNGIIFSLLMWIYVFFYICFLVYITKYFIKKRK